MNILGIYEELGVERYINAMGTYTAWGGSKMSEQTLSDMRDAASSFCDVKDLQVKVGRKIAENNKEWEDKLREIANLFLSCQQEASDRYSEKFENYLDFSEQEKKEWFKLEEEVNKIRIKEKDKAFDLMKQYYWDLWD